MAAMDIAPTSIDPRPVSQRTPQIARAIPMPVRKLARSIPSSAAKAAAKIGIVAPRIDAANAEVVRRPTRNSVWLSAMPRIDSTASRP